MKANLSRRAFLQICITTRAAGFLPGCRPKPSPPKPTSTTPKNTPIPTLTVTPTVPQRTPVTLPNTDTWKITSDIIGKQEYQISVNLPESYGAGNRFPVLYVTDGNENFPLVRTIYRELRDEEKIPEMLVIGIGYPTDNWDKIQDLRARDFTPFAYTPPYSGTPQQSFSLGTGGAPQFLRFIGDELMPLIDVLYATRPDDATLLGHSLGGLFTLYALFQGSGVFKRFVAGSPSIWWADAAIFSTEKAFADSHTDLDAHLYMGAGSEEGAITIDVNRMTDTLRQRKYPGLELDTQIFEGESHVSVVPFFISRGLRAVNSL
jgi:predicted alpha/beta superfamily hydrolase